MSDQILEIAAPEHPPKLLEPPATDPSNPGSTKQGPPPRKRRWWSYLLLAVIALAVLYLTLHGSGSSSSATKAAAAKGGKGAAGGATPVVYATAKTGNIGVYVSGLGAITPIYTVTVKSRVDGQLMTVHFNEGDLGEAG